MGNLNAIENQSQKLGFKMKVDLSILMLSSRILESLCQFCRVATLCFPVSKVVQKILWDSKHLPLIAHRSFSLKFGPSPKIMQLGVHYSTTQNKKMSHFVVTHAIAQQFTLQHDGLTAILYVCLFCSLSKPSLSPECSELASGVHKSYKSSSQLSNAFRTTSFGPLQHKIMVKK